MTWKSGTETTTRGYKFAYDPLDRLTAATYGEGSALTTNPNRFDEKVTQYDKNGNLKKLERRGKTSPTAYGVMDNLTFTHTGNQLLNVSDIATDPTYTGNFNFVDGNKGTGTEYVWDKNGNLVQDYNKQIANISYNSLNLPSKLQFRYGHMAEYLYDISGNKRQVKHTTTNQNLSVGWGNFKDITATQKASEKVTDYCSNIIYENGALKMILTPEGYVTLSGTTPTYHYYLRDHLGNNRVVVSQSGTVEQINHYYPFGGVFGEGTATTDQPYKYNDKELDRTNGLDLYDYSARYMDAAVGQFTTVDPLAEKYYPISPYVYVANNPVKYIDPDGMDIWEMDYTGRIIWKEGSDRHYLHALDADGNRTGSSIRIKDRTILDGLEGTDDIRSVTVEKGSKNDLFKVFKFAADNTQNEWVIYKYNQDNSTKYTLGTMSQRENAGNPEIYGINIIPDAKVHSHPNINTDRNSELSSMGVASWGGMLGRGDWANVVTDVKLNRTQRTLSYVYFQNTTNLYHISGNGPAFIRKINNNHNRFFFGTF